MHSGRLERIAPLAGALFAVIFAVGFLSSGETPDSNAPAEEIISHYDDAGGVLVGIIGLFAAALVFLFFLSILHTALRKHSQVPDWVDGVVFGGGVIYTVGLSIFAMTQIALVDAADNNADEVAQTLNVLDNNNFFPAIIGVSAMLLATAWHTLRGGILPTWLGWVTLILGIIAVAGPLGFIAFLAFPVWVLIVSIILYQRAGDEQPTPATGTPS